MSVVLIATETEGEVLEPGIYRVKLTSVEEKAGTKKVENGDGTSHLEPSIYLRWTFAVVEEGYEDAWPLRANSSTAFGPNAKARGWAEALIGRNLNVNEPCDFDAELIGHECQATVKVKVVGEKTYNEIESLAPIRKGKVKSNGSPSDALQRLQAAIDAGHMQRGEVLAVWTELGFKGRTRDSLSPGELDKAIKHYEEIAAPLADTDPSSLEF